MKGLGIKWKAMLRMCWGCWAGAVVAVSLLGETMPDYFGTFDVAMFTLFSVTGGEPWPHTLPRLNEDGTANWGVMLFCSAYFVITTWLILQVGQHMPFSRSPRRR